MNIIGERKSPKVLLNAFVMGSLTLLLLCLCAAALLFSATFLKKEEQRALISKDQLSHSFSFQYRPMTEEMWTGNYEAIVFRIGEIAKEIRPCILRCPYCR